MCAWQLGCASVHAASHLVVFQPKVDSVLLEGRAGTVLYLLCSVLCVAPAVVYKHVSKAGGRKEQCQGLGCGIGGRIPWMGTLRN